MTEETSVSDLPPFRPCDLCGGVDQDPRHSFAGAIDDVHPVDEGVRQTLYDNIDAAGISASEGARVIADFNDTQSTDRHLDCCAADGCPLKGGDQDEKACDHRVAAANGKTGEGMRTAALSLNKEG